MTTAHVLRAKRARELQAVLQDAVRVEHAMRSALAPIVNKWRTTYKRVHDAAGRFNSMVERLDPDLVVNVDEVVGPKPVLEILREALNLQVVPVLAQLREIGPKLHKLPTGKQIRTRAKKERRVAARVVHDQERARLEAALFALERRLNDPSELEMYRLDRNMMQRTERQPEFSPDAYRELTLRYIAQTKAALKKLKR